MLHRVLKFKIIFCWKRKIATRTRFDRMSCLVTPCISSSVWDKLNSSFSRILKQIVEISSVQSFNRSQTNAVEIMTRQLYLHRRVLLFTRKEPELVDEHCIKPVSAWEIMRHVIFMRRSFVDPRRGRDSNPLRSHT